MDGLKLIALDSRCHPAHSHFNPDGLQTDETRTPKLGSTPAPGVAGRALADSLLRMLLARSFETFPRARVFREGAENCARGGRAPFPNRNSDETRVHPH